MFASISKLSLFERNMSDDSLDFSVFFNLAFQWKFEME